MSCCCSLDYYYVVNVYGECLQFADCQRFHSETCRVEETSMERSEVEATQAALQETISV